MSYRYKGFHGSTIRIPKRRRGKPTVRKVQAQVTNIKRRLKKERMLAVQAEISGTLQQCSLPATAVHLNPAGGVTNGVPLDGETATLKSIRIKGWFASVGATNTGGRIDIVLDRRPVKGTIATFDEVYSPPVASGDTINSMMYPRNKTRFKLLASIRATSVTNENQRFYFERYIKMNHIITGSNGDYAQANQGKNAIIIFKWGDTAANLMTYAYITQTVIEEDS